MKNLKRALGEGTEIWKTGTGLWWLLGTVMMDKVHTGFFKTKKDAVDFGIRNGRFSPAIKDRLLSTDSADGVGSPEDLKGESVREAAEPSAEETYGKIKGFGVMALKGYARRIGMPLEIVTGIKGTEDGIDEIMGYLYGDDWMKDLMAKGAFKESAGMSRLGRLLEADVPTQHQIKIAIKTLKMPDAMVGVMGGPNKEQAREILKTKAGWSDKRIAALEGGDAKEGAWPLMSEPSR